MALNSSVSDGSASPPAGSTGGPATAWRPGRLPSFPASCVGLQPRTTLYLRDLLVDLRFSPHHILPNGLEDLLIVVVSHNLRRPVTPSKQRTVPICDLDCAVDEGLDLRVRKRELLFDLQLQRHVLGVPVRVQIPSKRNQRLHQWVARNHEGQILREDRGIGGPSASVDDIQGKCTLTPLRRGRDSPESCRGGFAGRGCPGAGHTRGRALSA